MSKLPPKHRYYQIAGITVQVESDLPFSASTFHPKFASFAVDEGGPDTVLLRHHFEIPDLASLPAGREIYRHPPWAIRETASGWTYLGIAADADDDTIHCVAQFSADYAVGDIFTPPHTMEWWRQGNLSSLTLFPTDQIWLAQLLAHRSACYVHSAGVMIDDQGLLFVGHSEAGKSTTTQLVRRALPGRATILCDDRNIVRLWPDGAHVHGTWSHGDVPAVSAAVPPLRAILFLEQARANELVPLTDRMEAWQRLLATLVKPLITAAWWQKEMDVLEQIIATVPCYTMRFDRSGDIVAELQALIAANRP
mgnify:FL=1